MKSSFIYYDGTTTEKIKVDKGESILLDILIEAEKGTISMVLEDGSGEEIFTIEESGQIEVKSEEKQTYKLTITASEAKGSYSMKVIREAK